MENTLPTFDDVVFGPTEDTAPVEEIQEVEETVEEIQEEEQESEQSEPLANLVYQTLVEQGYLDEDPDFNGSLDYIDEKLQELPKKYIDDTINSLPEHTRKVLQYVTTENVTEDEFKNYLKEFIKEENQIDISSSDSARSFLEEKLKQQGLRPAAIQAQLDDLEDSDELLTEAEKILNAEKKKTDQLQEQKIQQNQEQAKQQQEFMSSIQNTLKESNWDKPKQEAILKTMPKANEIIYKASGKPKAYLQIIDFLASFNGEEFDVSKFETKAKSKATEEIKTRLEKSGFSSTKTKGESGKPTSSSFEEFAKKLK